MWKKIMVKSICESVYTHCRKPLEFKAQEFVWNVLIHIVLQCPSNRNSHPKVRQPGQETWSTDDNSRPPNSWQPGRKLNKSRVGNGTSSKLELYKVTKFFKDSGAFTFPYLLQKIIKHLSHVYEVLQNLVVKFKLPQVATVILTCQSNFLSLEFFLRNEPAYTFIRQLWGPTRSIFFGSPEESAPQKELEPPSVNKMCLSGRKSAKRLTGKKCTPATGSIKRVSKEK